MACACVTALCASHACAAATAAAERLRRYNAYLIFGDKVALVDASHEKFHDLFLDTLEAQLKAAGAVLLPRAQSASPLWWCSRQVHAAHPRQHARLTAPPHSQHARAMRTAPPVHSTGGPRLDSAVRWPRSRPCARAACDLAGRDKIDYIFVSHTEPDHSGLIPSVLDRHPDATVCGSKVCLSFLQGLTHRCEGTCTQAARRAAASQRRSAAVCRGVMTPRPVAEDIAPRQLASLSAAAASLWRVGG